MRYHLPHTTAQRLSLLLLLSCTLLLLFSACAGAAATSAANTTLASQQVLIFPNVGITDLPTLDPAIDPDQNALIVIHMLFSGLLKTDKNSQVVADQATWQISPDGKIYTFTLKPGITFSDGTPVTAQAYVASWTRALLPVLASPLALYLERPIVGALAVSSGRTQTLSGVKALNGRTLEVILTQPTPYFLASLTNPLFFPLNPLLLAQYGPQDWTQHAVGSDIGTGPFIIQSWQHNVAMTFVPNPHYYGKKTHLSAVEMPFVDDPTVAFTASRASQYAFVWGLDPTDLPAAAGAGFEQAPLLQTDALFFDTTQPPFSNVAARQALAYAINKPELLHTIFNDAMTPASTMLPPGMPGYQSHFTGLAFNTDKARDLLHTAYPDMTLLPTLTFSYPDSLVPFAEAATLQHMWQSALDIKVNLRPVEEDAYNQEMQDHLISFGFISWFTLFADPYACLGSSFASSPDQQLPAWNNASFTRLIAQAEATTGATRLAHYNQAEQLAISQVAWLPLDHQNFTAIIPSWVHGVTLNAEGLYFGDWSDVYLLRH